MTPAGLACLGDVALRQAGLSRQKTAYLRDLCDKVSTGAVRLDALDRMTDDEVIEALTRVKGIGRWTAEMFLLFELGRPDVWPVDDYGVRNGWSIIHAQPAMISPRELQLEGERFRPHRSTVALYCWHAVHVARREAQA